MRFPACIKHNGRHMDVHGQCVHWGAPVALRPGHCQECGAETMRRYDLTTGEDTTVEAGSDAIHWHPQPARVTINEDALATAIVRASRAARQDRVPTLNVTTDQQTPYIRQPERNGHAKAPLGGIPELGE
jgi:hypothetical protein